MTSLSSPQRTEASTTWCWTARSLYCLGRRGEEAEDPATSSSSPVCPAQHWGWNGWRTQTWRPRDMSGQPRQYWGAQSRGQPAREFTTARVWPRSTGAGGGGGVMRREGGESTMLTPSLATGGGRTIQRTRIIMLRLFQQSMEWKYNVRFSSSSYHYYWQGHTTNNTHPPTTTKWTLLHCFSASTLS